MKRVFFDTNILLDQLDVSRKGHMDVRGLERAIGAEGAQVMCSWHSLSIVEYIGSKVFGLQAVHQVIRGIVNNFIIPKTGNDEAKIAFDYLSDDFEDAMQIAAAVAGGADFFVTRDRRGFVNCPIRVVTPQECARLLLA